MLAAFRYELRRFLSFSEEVTRAAGLEPRQHQLLLAIKGADGEALAITDIADRLQLKHHSAVELVKRAAARGLVQPRRDASDHRRVIVRVTALGEACLARLSRYHLDELQRRGPRLIESLSQVIEAVAAATAEDNRDIAATPASGGDGPQL